MKFEIGQRVAVYFWDRRCTGEVISVLPNGSLEVKLDSYSSGTSVHPKQCRRLVKKPRRRVWIKWQTMPKTLEPLGNVFVSRLDRSENGWVEFAEVRKK